MGAWIEIVVHHTKVNANLVAPFMGAWIEIMYSFIMRVAL